jgi:hypothetical protein
MRDQRVIFLFLFITMPSNAEQELLIHEDSEDEHDWEEIDVPEQQHLEITIQTAARPKDDTVVNKSVSFLMKGMCIFLTNSQDKRHISRGTSYSNRLP